VFQAWFVYQSEPPALPALPGLAATVEPLDVSGSSKFDLKLELARHAEDLVGYFEYRTDLFDRSTIEWLILRLRHLATAIANDPDAPLAALPWEEPS
jgi:non-ribosomal peptide synthetase component F